MKKITFTLMFLLVFSGSAYAVEKQKSPSRKLASDIPFSTDCVSVIQTVVRDSIGLGSKDPVAIKLDYKLGAGVSSNGKGMTQYKAYFEVDSGTFGTAWVTSKDAGCFIDKLEIDHSS